MKTLQRIEDANEREREDRYGRIRVSRSIRVLWVVYEDGQFVEEFDRKRDATRNHPDAVLQKGD